MCLYEKIRKIGPLLSLKQFLIWGTAYRWAQEKCWLVGCFGLNSPLKQYFSLYRLSPREREPRKDSNWKIWMLKLVRASAGCSQH